VGIGEGERKWKQKTGVLFFTLCPSHTPTTTHLSLSSMLSIPSATARPAGARRLAPARNTKKVASAAVPRRCARTLPQATENGEDAPISRRSAALTALAAAVVAVAGSAQAARVPMFADPVPGSRIGAPPKDAAGVAAADAPAPAAPVPVSQEILAARAVSLSGLAASAVYAAVTGGVPAVEAGGKKCVDVFFLRDACGRGAGAWRGFDCDFDRMPE